MDKQNHGLYLITLNTKQCNIQHNNYVVIKYYMDHIENTILNLDKMLMFLKIIFSPDFVIIC